MLCACRADSPGVTANRMHDKMGQRASDTAEIVFEDVKVPRAGLVGSEGQGFKIAMRTFDRSRPEVGAFAIGISQRALDESLKYAQQREAFGQAIANFQAVQFMLADMAIELEAMRLLTYKAAWLLDQGAPSSIGVQLCQGVWCRPDHADHHQRGPDFRRLWLLQRVSGGKADARRQAAPDL